MWSTLCATLICSASHSPKIIVSLFPNWVPNHKGELQRQEDNGSNYQSKLFRETAQVRTVRARLCHLSTWLIYIRRTQERIDIFGNMISWWFLGVPLELKEGQSCFTAEAAPPFPLQKSFCEIRGTGSTVLTFCGSNNRSALFLLSHSPFITQGGYKSKCPNPHLSV